ncbi:hypothetical protein A3B05_01735 [Candidatus Giovannonibacteria bacterium RIFCSPLOWO2_01_FULL_43_160]|uniref:Uncharacterized protein n=2 Tax=Candidatus Giovannoniibacteriota TaxID=1752738 RepID=A0A0G1L1B3_9BACT|nr:MAG: hypothetical protein UV72_C0009G0021 [Candidatus Giovannonibacteria bacterium GW2011_GWB1_43_13]KKS99042.1 MAG: hypothetical protein UV75_C0012G0013 [Candidatus Giovannonibacteria bacterium GW2011_GWA1_43_15]KKT20625.1 MAG: hypothetical protein UW05_C0034G0010 [Candidatus Giovannonibacteria bacterium GW2011_GWC2_43_8]KKT62372.1 MAG: hypothetical protein UW55_C0013G0013 [Candidatus Giovannonibacteria bacterium GW2011_GWA2_44_26]OGF59497.1 MAG: hypothetical protein A2652_01025 [Candidatus
MICYAVYDNKGYGPFAAVLVSKNKTFSPQKAIKRYAAEIGAKALFDGARPTKKFASASIKLCGKKSKCYVVYASEVAIIMA